LPAGAGDLRAGGDGTLDVQPLLQTPRIRAKPHEQVPDIDHQRDRSGVQKNAKNAGARDGAGMGFHEAGLERFHPLPR
jgi:hypothetical protein